VLFVPHHEMLADLDRLRIGAREPGILVEGEQFRARSQSRRRKLRPFARTSSSAQRSMAWAKPRPAYLRATASRWM